MRLPTAFKTFGSANLRLRILSSAILVPITFLAVYLGGFVYGAVVTCTVTLGFYEWVRLVTPRASVKTVGMSCAMVILLMSAAVFFSLALGALLGVVFTLILFLIFVRDRDDQAGWVALGIPYMGGSGLALLALRAIPVHGIDLLFFLLITVWSTDIGAFISGRLIGGPKLLPAISPSKTWAGLLGGMALALVLGYLVARGLGAAHPGVALVLSPVLAVIAQVGDLFESALKRRSGVKESGDLIPGHGGVLDRIDGLVFAAVFIFLFQAALGERINWW